MKKHSDIMYLDHPAKVIGKPMSMSDRAKIFLPFAALTGYEASIAAAGRYTENDFVLEKDRVEEIDGCLRQINDMMLDGIYPDVYLVYYDNSSLRYCEVAGKVSDISTQNNTIYINGKSVSFSNIYSISING